MRQGVIDSTKSHYMNYDLTRSRYQRTMPPALFYVCFFPNEKLLPAMTMQLCAGYTNLLCNRFELAQEMSVGFAFAARKH
jgi:hypothetical protein